MAVFLQDLPRLSAAGHSLSGLPGGAATYAAAQLARSTHAGEATGLALPLTVVVPTRDDAARAFDELSFWLRGAGLPVFLLPADDVSTRWNGAGCRTSSASCCAERCRTGDATS